MGTMIVVLHTRWSRLKTIHAKRISSFSAILQKSPTLHITFDNHIQCILKKDQHSGKSALTHLGTPYYARQHLETVISPGTICLSPMWIKFVVTKCTEVFINTVISITT